MPKLDHVALPVSDLGSAIAFYEKKLGLKLLFQEVDESHGEAFAFLEMEGAKLELIQKIGGEDGDADFERPAIREPYCPHMAIETDDMDAVMKMLAEKGVPIVKGPLEIAGSVRWVYAHDPDNNIIEFMQWL